jgi:YHS domain-containing protein
MKTIQSIAAGALLCAAAAFAFVGCASHQQPMGSASNESYKLTKCVVSGDDLGDKPYTFTHNGQQVKLCCKDCLAKFDKDPEKYMAKINEAK